MCGNPPEEQDYAVYSLRMTAHLVEASSITSFTATRLNQTTFRLVEDDRHIERPMIYVKLYPTCVVVIDTGCNDPMDKSLPVTGLRRFIETVPIHENKGKPLNPDGRLPYVILISHCHYDHIGGLETFDGSSYHIYCSRILLSEIVAKSRLHHDSLRESRSLPPMGLDLERVTGVSDGYSLVDADGVELNLQLLHAPGHSPDHMVVLDLDESTVFLGDSAYEQSPLFYAYGGDLVLHIQTLARLETLITDYEKPEGAAVWTAACGHFSSGLNAISLLQRTKKFILDVIEGKVPSQSQEANPFQVDGVLEFFTRDELAMACPDHLLQAAKSSSISLSSS
ncbi:uncharacterized protein N7515_000715 [Penicillium bovifimosum]|uniref:Metallo-beta-lactamase domain-containing protein n=1 Tax=Penicillium bovifimosum TaxID=126998 RepID=A0A9W9HFG2_9EURO|nr:uncharacterized protein N7515_000715 [Penicillium bovifimosum]KAJ5146151.1 hypothetical protein N7515_000715 [Penicillium bovifimosum]